MSEHTDVPALGGAIKNLLVKSDDVEVLKKEALAWSSITLTERQINELELLLNGGFSPLEGYMDQANYQSVLDSMRLVDGTVFPLPICLGVTEKVAESLAVGEQVALRDHEGFMPAFIKISEIWKVDQEVEAQAIFETTSLDHPGVRQLLESDQTYYIAGKVQGIELPMHFDFELVRDTPQQLRAQFHKMGWQKVVAFTTGEPMHRLQRQITLDVAREVEANVLVHPLLGEDQPGDMNRFARVRAYRQVVRGYPHQIGFLSLLPLSRRFAGPREALLHAIVNQNYGCSHMIVGPEYASPKDVKDKSFYEPKAAQKLLMQYEDDLAIRIVATDDYVYSPTKKRFVAAASLEEDEEGLSISQVQVRERLRRGESLPEWFTFPDVEKELALVFPSNEKIGFTLFFTGLSGSGKSTLARMVHSKLIEEAGRPVTLLDGDIVRLNLSSELGFSKEHRNLNIRRIGFVANEISKNGGIAICAPIAPYTAMRREARDLIEQHGAFIEIHVSTPLEVCEARDRKGLYAKARQGLIPEFTGISDPYEIPEHPELTIDTSQGTPMAQVQKIMLYLIKEGYLGMKDDE